MVGGKLPNGDGLDNTAFRWGRVVLQRVKENFKSSFGMILTGFVDNGPVCSGRGGRATHEAATPEFYAIGSGAAAAMEVLIRREQNIFCSAARSIFHVYEALKAARQHEKTVGPPAPYVVMRPASAARPNGFMRFPAESRLVRGWYKAYRKRSSTKSLNRVLPNEQFKFLLKRHSPIQILSHEPVDPLPMPD